MLPAFKDMVDQQRRRHHHVPSQYDSDKIKSVKVDSQEAADLLVNLVFIQCDFICNIDTYTAYPPIPPPPSPSPPQGTGTASPQPSPAPSPQGPLPASSQPQPYFLRPDNPKCRKHNPQAHMCQLAGVGPSQKEKTKRKRKKKTRTLKRKAQRSTAPQPYKASPFSLLPIPDLKHAAITLTNTTLRQVRQR